jgi:PD-(D/E)XK nuclease superfamily
MSTSEEFSFDSFLSDMAVEFTDTDRSESGGTGESGNLPFQESGYEGKIDYRIRQLSYSSILTLHSCPRKFQLYRLRTTFKTEESVKSTVTFAYGHVLGEAIQLALENKSEQEIIWRMYQGWHTDLFNEDTKLNKSFFGAVIAIKKFLSLRSAGFLKEYELVYYNGKPACELSFSVIFPDGFRLRGFVDAVLRHKVTGKVIVLECKTTGAATINPAAYKNSAQAIGYSIVLDAIFPDLSSYEVLYLIYNTKSGDYVPITFQKTYLQRALWIRELLLDIETIKMYEEAEVYPMHGESCYAFFRDCEYLNVCQLSTEYLTKPCTPDQEDKTDYQITLTLDDLLTTQLAKAEI